MSTEDAQDSPIWRVLSVDDHPLMSQVIKAELETGGQIACTTVHTGEDAVAEYVAADNSDDASAAYDLVLVDYDLDEKPGSTAMNGMDVVRKLLAFDADAKTILVTASHSPQLIREANAANAFGFLTKDALASSTTPSGVLVQPLTKFVFQALHGERVYSSVEITSVLIDEAHGTTGPRLTDRELEVLRHIAQGMTSKEIGKTLHCSHHTIRDHVKSIYTKLDVNDRAGAVTAGFKLELLT